MGIPLPVHQRLYRARLRLVRIRTRTRCKARMFRTCVYAAFQFVSGKRESILPTAYSEHGQLKLLLMKVRTTRGCSNAAESTALKNKLEDLETSWRLQNTHHTKVSTSFKLDHSVFRGEPSQAFRVSKIIAITEFQNVQNYVNLQGPAYKKNGIREMRYNEDPVYPAPTYRKTHMDMFGTACAGSRENRQRVKVHGASYVAYVATSTLLMSLTYGSVFIVFGAVIITLPLAHFIATHTRTPTDPAPRHFRSFVTKSKTRVTEKLKRLACAFKSGDNVICEAKFSPKSLRYLPGMQYQIILSRGDPEERAGALKHNQKCRPDTVYQQKLRPGDIYHPSKFIPTANREEILNHCLQLQTEYEEVVKYRVERGMESLNLMKHPRGPVNLYHVGVTNVDCCGVSGSEAIRDNQVGELLLPIIRYSDQETSVLGEYKALQIRQTKRKVTFSDEVQVLATTEEQPTATATALHKLCQFIAYELAKRSITEKSVIGALCIATGTAALFGSAFVFCNALVGAYAIEKLIQNHYVHFNLKNRRALDSSCLQRARKYYESRTYPLQHISPHICPPCTIGDLARYVGLLKCQALSLLAQSYADEGVSFPQLSLKRANIWWLYVTQNKVNHELLTTIRRCITNLYVEKRKYRLNNEARLMRTFTRSQDEVHFSFLCNKVADYLRQTGFSDYMNMNSPQNGHTAEHCELSAAILRELALKYYTIEAMLELNDSPVGEFTPWGSVEELIEDMSILEYFSIFPSALRLVAYEEIISHWRDITDAQLFSMLSEIYRLPLPADDPVRALEMLMNVNPWSFNGTAEAEAIIASAELTENDLVYGLQNGRTDLLPWVCESAAHKTKQNYHHHPYHSGWDTIVERARQHLPLSQSSWEPNNIFRHKHDRAAAVDSVYPEALRQVRIRDKRYLTDSVKEAVRSTKLGSHLSRYNIHKQILGPPKRPHDIVGCHPDIEIDEGPSHNNEPLSTAPMQVGSPVGTSDPCIDPKILDSACSRYELFSREHDWHTTPDYLSGSPKRSHRASRHHPYRRSQSGRFYHETYHARLSSPCNVKNLDHYASSRFGSAHPCETADGPVTTKYPIDDPFYNADYTEWSYSVCPVAWNIENLSEVLIEFTQTPNHEVANHVTQHSPYHTPTSSNDPFACAVDWRQRYAAGDETAAHKVLRTDLSNTTVTPITYSARHREAVTSRASNLGPTSPAASPCSRNGSTAAKHLGTRQLVSENRTPSGTASPTRKRSAPRPFECAQERTTATAFDLSSLSAHQNINLDSDELHCGHRHGALVDTNPIVDANNIPPPGSNAADVEQELESGRLTTTWKTTDNPQPDDKVRQQTSPQMKPSTILKAWGKIAKRKASTTSSAPSYQIHSKSWFPFFLPKILLKRRQKNIRSPDIDLEIAPTHAASPYDDTEFMASSYLHFMSSSGSLELGSADEGFDICSDSSIPLECDGEYYPCSAKQLASLGKGLPPPIFNSRVTNFFTRRPEDYNFTDIISNNRAWAHDKTEHIENVDPNQVSHLSYNNSVSEAVVRLRDIKNDHISVRRAYDQLRNVMGVGHFTIIAGEVVAAEDLVRALANELSTDKL